MKIVVYFLVGFAIVIQLFSPDFKNPTVDEKVALNADPHVMNVLKTSCYDCHSDETKYPWYQNVAPVSWIMSDHIQRGRKALDFSNWANIDPKVKLLRLERATQVVKNEMMPKHEYLLMHKNAILNNEEKQTLEKFFDEQIIELGGSTSTLKKFNI
ncbi:MAG: heme-binding domain-containing protein [Sulfuricurvum sp.]|uniref:heme-binding domain-containing protein n=1 Tax=Sulfuricurvum sp. TaxID=2025608 RepID=UPI00262ED45A|nr:heme-binding domain-containing protein [Sulfuricurvum sp.]MDD2784733.1 heme-binding domain-containing protein [Sulfuricurvum sp.]